MIRSQFHSDTSSAEFAMAQTVRAATRGTLRFVQGTPSAPIRVEAELTRDAGRRGSRTPGGPVTAVEPKPATAADRAAFSKLLIQLDGQDKPGALLDAVRDALLAHPDLAELLFEELLSGVHTDLTASTVIHALKMAGHAEAQLTLANLAADPRIEQRNRVRAVIDLGGVGASTPETRERLWAMSESAGDAGSAELATTATLALGRLGRTLRETGDPDYVALRDRIVASLDIATTDRSRTSLLAAAGNTGDPSLRPVVAVNMDSRNPQVRATAAKALGRIPGSATVLVEKLSNDANPRVRNQLARGLLNQETLGAIPMRIVARQLANETDEGARYAMVRVLGKAETLDADTRATLRQLMRTESSHRIRGYVAARLAGPAWSGGDTTR